MIGISAKRAFAATSLFAAAISAVAAADLPVKALPPPPPGWTGPYGGLVGGYGIGHSDQTDPGAIPLPVADLVDEDGHFRVSGGLVGGTLGYNWQRGAWVYGIEGDLAWANLSGRSDVCGTAPHPCGANLNAFGTFRGRVGYAAGSQGDWLLYATGGVAIGDVRGWDALGPTSGHDWRAGWTAGLGVEKRFAPHWTAKIEYLYADLGKAQVFNVTPGVPESVGMTANIIRAGVNYNFGAPLTSPRSFAMQAPIGAARWAGWYFGGNAGYLDGANRINTDATVISTSTTPVTAPAMAAAATSVLSTGNGGFIGGAQAGHNFMLSPMWLAGFEVDIQGSTLRGSANGTNPVIVDTVAGAGTGTFVTSVATSRGLDYLGTIRARLGATVTPNLLLYATGGLAYGRARSSTSLVQTTAVGGVPTVATAGSLPTTVPVTPLAPAASGCSSANGASRASISITIWERPITAPVATASMKDRHRFPDLG
jgi:outer membrane immunogenic protein